MSKGKKKSWEPDPQKQSREDKMRLFRKVKEVKQKTPKPTPTPGKIEIGQWGKGVNTFIEEIERFRYKPGTVVEFDFTPRGRHGFSEFSGGGYFSIPEGDGYYEIPDRERGMRDEQKLKEATDYLSRQTGQYIQYRHSPDGDYWEFRCRDRMARLDGTGVAVSNIAQLVQQLARHLQLEGMPRVEGATPEGWDIERLKQLVELGKEDGVDYTKPKSPTEQWAEKWAKKHAS